MTERVAKVLRRRGAPPATVEDAVQTAVLRALNRDEGFANLDGLFQWSIVVAWHEVQAEWRRTARFEASEMPEQPYGSDPATVVESHIALDAVREALSSLTDAERRSTGTRARRGCCHR